MKIYLLTLLFCLLVFVSGCTSNSELITYMQDYLDVNGKTCLKYVENDQNLTGRDRERYIARHRFMQKLLNDSK